jgi:hypothetical protein
VLNYNLLKAAFGTRRKYGERPLKRGADLPKAPAISWDNPERTFTEPAMPFQNAITPVSISV